MLQLILAVMLVSFDTSIFGSFIANVAVPFMWIFFWPVNILINLVIQEWWVLVVYIINLVYLYFVTCLMFLAYSSFKNRQKWIAKINFSYSDTWNKTQD